MPRSGGGRSPAGLIICRLALWGMAVLCVAAASGCGVATGGAIYLAFALFGGDSGSPSKSAPAVTVETPATRSTSGTQDIAFTVVDGQANPVDIQVTFSATNLDPTAGSRSGSATTASPTTGLASSSAGTQHTFVWDYLADLGDLGAWSATLTFTASDGTGASDPATTSSFLVGNDPPEFVSDPQIYGSSGNLIVVYQIRDTTGDVCTMAGEFASPEIGAGSNQAMTVVYGALDVATFAGGSPVTGSFTWDTLSEPTVGTTNVSNVTVTVRASDPYGGSVTRVSAPFFITNNRPPQVITQGVPPRSITGQVPVQVLLVDTESDPVSLAIAFSATNLDPSGGTASGTATMTGSTSNLPSSPGGAAQTLDWDYAADLPDTGAWSATLTFTPSDAEGAALPLSTVAFVIGNDAPAIPDPGAGFVRTTGTAGNIVIEYDLSDTTGDSCSVAPQFSTDGGTTFQSITRTLGGGLAGLDTPDDGSAQSFSFTWDTFAEPAVGATNLTGVIVALTPSDTWGATGVRRQSAPFDITNDPNVPPVAAVFTPSGTVQGDILIQYLLSDGNSDPTTIAIEFSTGGPYQGATESTDPISEGIGPFATTPSAALHTFVWDSRADVGDQDVAAARIRVTAQDTEVGAPAETFPFAVANNIAPSATLTSPAGTLTGPIPLAYVLSDTNSDAASVAVDYSLDGGTSWDPATELPGPPSEGRTGLATSPAGTPHTFVWDVVTDLGETQLTGLLVRITPSDTKAGPAATSTAFDVDNHVSPYLVSAQFEDPDLNGIEVGDRLALTFSDPVFLYRASASHFTLRVVGDSFGWSGVGAGPLLSAPGYEGWDTPAELGMWSGTNGTWTSTTDGRQWQATAAGLSGVGSLPRFAQDASFVDAIEIRYRTTVASFDRLEFMEPTGAAWTDPGKGFDLAGRIVADGAWQVLTIDVTDPNGTVTPGTWTGTIGLLRLVGYAANAGDSIEIDYLVLRPKVASTSVSLELGNSPVLRVAGAYSDAQLSAGSPSGLDVSPALPPGRITNVFGVDATDLGTPGLNDTGLDIGSADTARPYIVGATFEDAVPDKVAGAGDRLRVYWSEPILLASPTAADFVLPVAGDSLGASPTFTAESAIVTRIALGLGASLMIVKDFDPTRTAALSPSGIDVPAAPTGRIYDVAGNLPLDGGLPGIDGDGLDIVPGFVLVTATGDNRSWDAADIDGDGDLDLLRVPYSLNQPVIYVQIASGTYVDESGTRLPSPRPVGATAEFLDVDRDGDPDILASRNPWVAGQAILINDGAGVFVDESGARLPAGDIQYPAIGDVDRDGKPDIVASGRLLLNDGSGAFAWAPAAQMPAYNPSNPAVLVDIEQDGDLDVISASAVFINGGSGFFTDQSSRLASSFARWAAGDLDGDGDVDLVGFSSMAPGGVQSNNGTGVFLAGQTLPNPFTLIDYPQVCGDIDNDGDVDVDAASWALVNDGTGSLLSDPRRGLAYGAWYVQPRVVDVDLDGDLDGLAGGYLRRNQTPAHPPDYADRTATWLPATITGGAGAVALDADRDGDNDVYVAGGGQDRFLRNDGAGIFTDASGGVPAETSAGSAAVAGDFDRDGDDDVIVLNGGAGGVQDRFLRNNRNGTFTDQTVARLPAIADDSRAGAAWDFDRDGDLDVFVANDGQDLLLVNDGAGVFTDGTALRLPALAEISQGVATGDVDRDGDRDIFVASPGQDRLYVNDSAGVFTDATATALPADTGDGRTACIGDFDKDGDQDIFVCQNGQSVFLENTGGAVFADATGLRVPALSVDATAAVAGDIDRDGDLDVVLAVRAGDDLLLLNDGSGNFSLFAGAFTPDADQTVGALLFDADKDGDLDAFFTNTGGQDRLFEKIP